MEEFTLLEIEFLAEINNLPEEYIQYLLPFLEEGLGIPCKEPRVGVMEIKIFPNFIHIKIGNHTQARLSNAKGAIKYIKNVLTDQIVFYFHEERQTCREQ